jgi:hypothetical protein
MNTEAQALQHAKAHGHAEVLSGRAEKVSHMQRLIDRCGATKLCGGSPDDEDAIYRHALEIRRGDEPHKILCGRKHAAIVLFDAGRVYYAAKGER